MGKIDPRALNEQLKKRLDNYSLELKKLYEKADKKIALLVSLQKVDPNKVFSFDDLPQIKGQINKVYQLMAKDMHTLIQGKEKDEWIKANTINDDLVKSVLKTSAMSAEVVKRLMPQNFAALKSFQDRKTNGFKLSDRIWKYTEQHKNEMQNAIDTALANGTSAADLSRSIRSLLNEPDNLFRRVKNSNGELVPSKPMITNAPGTGKYNSSYKNAMRLARTEITMAYRHADMLRYRELNFVIGYTVNLSDTHEIDDICDDLMGDYPKDFEFIGWHPNCLCFVTSILASDEEISNYEDELIAGNEDSTLQTSEEVKEVPEGFKSWVSANAERSQGWKEQPYFIRDNFVGGKISGGLNIATTQK